MTDQEKRGMSTGSLGTRAASQGQAAGGPAAGYAGAVVGTTALLGFLGLAFVGSEGHPVTVIAALSVTGALVLTFGASGLVLTVIQGREPWAVHAVRWCLVALVGALMVSPGWGIALAIAVVLLGLTWRVVGEQRS